MKIFHCDHCGQLLFFENSLCINCGHVLAYLPGLRRIASLELLPDGEWRSPLAEAAGRKYRLCQNYANDIVCNWAVRADDPEPLCLSCRTTMVIPDLSVPGNKEAWIHMESAKRRLFYSLMGLGLPITNRKEDPQYGLAFHFLANIVEGAPPILTGHDDGVITINLAEADSAQRESTRLALGESYRTVLGHFRHEIGHYYWDRLIADSEYIDEFRTLFGDERQDYTEALKQHYASGANNTAPACPNPDFVSAYASSHPWEDWAETWAHYLHMIDALETAHACGLKLAPARKDEPRLSGKPGAQLKPESIETMVSDWVALTYVLNNLNRSLGLSDAYPFVLSDAVIAKLAFVARVTSEASRRS